MIFFGGPKLKQQHTTLHDKQKSYEHSTEQVYAKRGDN